MAPSRGGNILVVNGKVLAFFLNFQTVEMKQIQKLGEDPEGGEDLQQHLPGQVELNP